MGRRIEYIRRRAAGDGRLQLGVVIAAAANVLEFDVDSSRFGEGFGDGHGDVVDAVLVPAHKPFDGDSILRGGAHAHQRQKGRDE